MTTSIPVRFGDHVEYATPVGCLFCPDDATHLAIRADESEYPLCPTHAKIVRDVMKKAPVNLGAGSTDTVKIMTRAALLRRHYQMEERYTRAWKYVRAMWANGAWGWSYAKERQAEDRYYDASHKFDLSARRCRAMGMNVSSF